MPEVVMKLGAEEGQLVNALLKVVEAQKQVEDGAKRIKTASQDAGGAMGAVGNAAGDVGKRIADNLIPGIGNIRSVGDAVGVAWGLVEKSIEKTSQRAAEFHKELESIVSAAARAGQIRLLPELQQKVEAMKSEKVSGDERQSLLAGAMSEFGGKLGASQILEAVQFGVRGAEAGFQGGEAAQVFGSLRSAFGGESAENIQAVAGKLLGAGGKIGGDELKVLMRAAAGGQSLDTAAASLFAMRTSGEGPKAVAAFESLTGKTGDDLLMKDPAAQARAEELKNVREREQSRIRELEQKDRQLAGQIDLVPDHEKERLKHQRRAISGEQGTIRDTVQELSAEISRLSDTKIARPELAAINALPENEQFFAALQRPDLLPAGQQAAGRSFAGAMGKFGAAPDVVAKSLADQQHLEATSEKFRASEELSQAQVIAADAARNQKTDPSNMRIARSVELTVAALRRENAPELEVDIAKYIAKAAGQVFGPGGAEFVQGMATTQVPSLNLAGGGPGGGMTGEQADELIKNTKRRGNTVSREGGNE